jgi:cobalt-zinc-cadmium efflux system membrane fusion protein
MGLDVEKIEKGEFYHSYPIKSPMNGFVSTIGISLGQYVEPQQTIAEIIDNNSFQLKLYVFEKNIDKINIGQTVEFYTSANKGQKYQATLNAIGKIIMPDSKSIECYSTIANHKSINLVSNQFVEGEIFASIDSVLAVPETALIQSENEQYILMFEKEENAILYFSKTKVNAGRKANNYIELIGSNPLKKLLLTGTYNIVIE